MGKCLLLILRSFLERKGEKTMHMHKFEKIWLIFGIGALVVFLSVVGVSAFYLGNKPPSCLTTIDPKKLIQRLHSINLD